MIALDVPYVPMAQSQIVLARADQVRGDVSSKERTIGVCKGVQSLLDSQADNSSVVATLIPHDWAKAYIERYEKIKIKEPIFGNLELLVGPKNGNLEIFKDTDGTQFATYIPSAGFLGVETVIFRVSVDGLSVKISYLLKVTRDPADAHEVQNRLCGKTGDFWKISNLLEALSLDADLAGLDSLHFADLPASSLGQTTGTGPTAQITLDTTAAGHGWYIDYTPFLNDEYLPTSNPLEWIAKPGSEAEGKMDLLTVLLHEYGHAHGLEHSGDPHALMSTTLQAGVRHLPTSEELDLMAQLLGVAQETGTASPVPYDPFSPPGTPLPSTIGLAAFIAARQRRSSPSSALTQFEVAANPTLTNPQFADRTGWSESGNVAIQNGSATLSETPTAQTRLNQAFVLGANDRFLSFTLSGIALDNVSSAPDDAFEVALIDANTGLSLLGNLGLSHDDAFYNLQADGTEFKASGVSTVKNADGSRTVLVDLAGVAVGTVVNLSFDLIGFGLGAEAVSSHVTVKELHLGQPLQALDDAATLAEDASIVINALANDIGATAVGVKPVLVNGPAHGNVAITADGSFRYTPVANWFGEDSFSYSLTLSNGGQEANVALVKITVTPVNDAPSLQKRAKLGFKPLHAKLKRQASHPVSFAGGQAGNTAPPAGSLAPNCCDQSCQTEMPRTANGKGSSTDLMSIRQPPGMIFSR